MPIEKFISQIKQVGLTRTYSPGETILVQGEPGDKIFFLIKGKVKVSLYTENGNEIILSILTPINFFGEMALFNDNIRSANVTAIEKCQVIEVGKEVFFKFMKQNVDTTFSLIIELVKRLRDANKKIYLMSLTKAEEKLVYYLKEKIIHNISKKNSKNDLNEYEIELPTHAEIGKELGLTRETVTKVLNKMHSQNLISGTKGKITISDEIFF